LHLMFRGGVRVHLREDLAEARSVRANFTLLPRVAAYGTGGWRWVVDLARAGLIGTAPVAPLVAAVLALAAYLSKGLAGLPSPSFEVGIIALAIGWLSIGAIYAGLGLTHVRRANATTFCELSNLLTELRGAFCALCVPSSSEQPADRETAEVAARNKFEGYLEQAERGLEKLEWERALWVLGVGYVSAWRLLHRAQEALIYIEDIRQVALRARYDQLRLAGAHMENRDQLVAQLKTVDHSLMRSPADCQASPSAMCEDEARLIVATVRQTLNDFRDDNRAALVRSRIHLMCTTLVSGLIGYAALWLALAAGVHTAQLQAAAAYYVVGALVGLFSRLNAEIRNDVAVDDFGLSGVRLVATPQLSGVAGVLGVGLLAVVGITQHGGSDSLVTAFDLAQSPMNIVTAGIFGLTPGLLLERLRQQTDDVKKHLRSTLPQTGNVAAA
jgi:hypothetical protein